MTQGKIEEGIQALIITKEELIEAPIAIAFKALLIEVGEGGSVLKDLKLEAWPGGRWFRDTGSDSGHFWGHVQVIKPPKLLEICGPMFMSYPAINHLQYRLVEEGATTRLTLTHRGMGQIPVEQREEMVRGWNEWLAKIKAKALELAK